MIKRIHSMIMALFMAFTLCFVPLISGCSESGKLADENRYTVAQWLSIVEDGFGMNYYTNQEPVMQNVLRDDSRFDTVQVAVEWGLISADDGLDLDSKVTKEFCADTLVRAINFSNSGSEKISDESKINPKYLESVKVALNNGIFSLNSGKFEPTKVLEKQDADLAFDIAHDKWVNFTFDESYNHSTVRDNVINFGGVDSGVAELAPISPSDYFIEYSGSRDFFAGGSYSDTTTKTVTFKAGAVPDGLTEGSVLSFPYNDVIPMDFAVVVDSVVTNADGSVTVKTHNAELYEIYESLDIRGTEQVNFDGARVFGPNGTEILPASNSKPLSKQGGVVWDDSRPGMYIPGSQPIKTKKLNGEKIKFEIDLDDIFTVVVEIEGEEVELSLEAKLSGKDDPVETKIALNQTFAASISEDVNIKWPNWFEGRILPSIDNAYIKCNFNSHNKTTLSRKQEAEKKLKDVDLKKLYEEFAEKVKSSKISNSKLGQAFSKKICSIALGPYGLTFDLKLQLSLEGELTFTTDLNGCFGIEYRNKHLQGIGDLKIDRRIDLSGKIEASLFGGFAYTLLGKTVADVGGSLGLGAVAKSSLFQKSAIEGVYDAECALPMSVFCGESPQDTGEMSFKTGLYVESGGIDTCLDFKLYPVLKLQACTKGCLLRDALGIGLEVEFLNENHAFFNLHWENGAGMVESCTREAGEAPDITVGKDLKLNLPEDRECVRLYVGEEYKNLKITEIPNGISVDEVTVSVDNTNVVNAECLLNKPEGWSAGASSSVTITKDSTNINGEFYIKEPSKGNADHFILTGLSDGTAKLTISAGTYSKVVDVIVGNGGIEKVTEGRFVVSDTTLILKGTESKKITIESAPEEYSIADFSFTSSKSDVATVDQAGNVVAQNVTGSTVIYITSSDGKYQGACMVTVIAE